MKILKPAEKEFPTVVFHTIDLGTIFTHGARSQVYLKISGGVINLESGFYLGYDPQTILTNYSPFPDAVLTLQP